MHIHSHIDELMHVCIIKYACHQEIKATLNILTNLSHLFNYVQYLKKKII